MKRTRKEKTEWLFEDENKIALHNQTVRNSEVLIQRTKDPKQ